MPKKSSRSHWPGTLFLLLTLLLAAGTLPAAEAVTALDYVTERIICDCGCNNLIVKDCTCGRADEVRSDVAARLARGQTPDEILQAYVDEYGEQILAAPTRRGFNLVGWILPFAVVLAGTILLVVVLRRWSRVPTEEAPLLPPLGAGRKAAAGPSFLKRVEEELDEMER